MALAAGVEVRIVDPQGHEQPRGEPGEILIRGYNVMVGYLDDPAQTAEAVDVDRSLAPVPLVSTFLLERTGDATAAAQPNAEGQLCRYVVTLRVVKMVQANNTFDFTDHLEGVPDWTDSLVVDVGPTSTGGLGAYTGWNSQIPGALDLSPKMPDPLVLTAEPASRGGRPNVLVGQVDLPEAARSLSVFGPTAAITIRVRDRRPTAPPSTTLNPTSVA